MKKSLLHIAILSLIFVLFNDIAYPANELFRSNASGNWSSNSTWQMSTDGGENWIAATLTPTNASSTITIRSPNVVTVNTNVSADQLVVNTGGQITINTGITLTITDGAGTDFYLPSGAVITGAGTLQTQGTSTSMEVKYGSNFNAAFKINTGVTSILDGTSPYLSVFNNSLTIDAGATLYISDGAYAIQAMGAVTNNGTINASNSYFYMRGSSLINNGAIPCNNFYFDSTTAISGTGTFTGNSVAVRSSGNVTLSNNLTFSPGNSLTVNTGGILNLNSRTLTFNSGTFNLNNGATLSGGGIFLTQSSVSLHLSDGSNFNVPLKINTGSTTVYNGTGSYYARLFNTVTVDAGAVMAVQNGGYFVQLMNTLTNNGTISTTNSTLILRGSSMINNGSVTVYSLYFDTTTALSGTGTFTGNFITINTSGNVTLQNSSAFSILSNFTISTGGTLNLNSQTFTFTSGLFEMFSGSNLTGNGLFRTQNNVTLSLRTGSNFNVPLKINTGTAIVYNTYSPWIAVFYNTVTIDAGAVLAVYDGGYYAQAMSTVTNNGTISTASSTFIMRGASLINNGSITAAILSFDSTTAMSGTGTYTSNTINIQTSGNVTLNNNISFSPPGYFNVYGTLNTSTFNFTLSCPNVGFYSTAIINGTGFFRTTGNMNIACRTGCQINSPFEVSYGIVTVNNPISPYYANFNGSITIDIGAELSISAGYTVLAYGNVIVNGVFSGASYLSFFGSAFINNGEISVSYPFFESGSHTLSGTGKWNYGIAVLSGCNLTLSSDHQMSSVNINAGGTFNISGRTLKLSAGGIPLINNGTFTTANSTIEYNGVISQEIAVTNVSYNCLTINDSVGVNLYSAITVPGILKLYKGAFNIGSNLTLGSNATIVRERGSLTSAPTFGTAVNVIYSGTAATTSSFELPAASSVLKNLTINNSGGVTLSSACTVNDSLFLILGTLTNGSNLTLANGVKINRTNGLLFSAPVFGTLVNVIYSGTTAVNTGFEIPITTTILNNLTINNSGGVTLTGIKTVNGTLILQNGAFAIGANTLTLNGGITITSGSLTGGASSNLTVSGSAATLTLQSISLNNLTLNRANGLTLNGNITINGAMTLTNGDVNLNGKTIYLGTSATLSETPGNTVKGNTGSITTTRTLNNITSLNVGGLGAVLTTTQNLGSTVITRIHSAQTGNSNSGILRSFDITPTNNTNLNATLVFNYDESELNSIPEANLILFRSTNSGTNWMLRGGTLNATNNNVTLTGISSLSRWTLGNKNNPLVLQSLQLTAMIEGFYNSVNGQMTEDTVTVFLRYSYSPYAVVDSAKTKLSSAGVGSYIFRYAADGVYYYLQLKHRNALETWSKTAMSFSGSVLNYNFTTDSAKAYGNNMTKKGTKWVLFVGDVSQEGVIDGTDMSLLDNAAAVFTTGYVKEDCNGDNVVDGSDGILIENNAYNFISVAKP